MCLCAKKKAFNHLRDNVALLSPHGNLAMTSNDETKVNHQPQVVQCFERLIERNNAVLGTNQARGFKNRAHKKVIEDLLTHFGDENPLLHTSQLKGRKGYGKSTIERIQEIVSSGTLKELDHDAPVDPHEACARELMTVTGIGPVKAKKIAELGGSLLMLREAVHDHNLMKPYKLTSHQLMGLKYYEDLQHRIPRETIQQFDELLQAECKKQHIPCQAVVCGSYRRGKEDSGDIDILLSRFDWESSQQPKACLQVVLQHLEKLNVLVDHLTSTTTCKTKYMGFLRIPNYPYACRVDIRAVVNEQYIPALAYFTGSGEENMRLRSIALKQKKKLNEYSLTHTETGQTVALTSEEQLYEALGEPYVVPTQR